MPRYKLTIEYDGSHYFGWQKQDNQPSIQAALEQAAFRFSGVRVEVVGAGRTDAGVHATAQVAHVDLPKTYDPFRILQALNYYLFDPAATEENETLETLPANRIAILNVEEVTEEFHARFSATKRYYQYHIVVRRPRLALDAGRAWRSVEELDVNAMQEAAQFLLGHHDFSSFRDTKCQAKSPIKTLDQLAISQQGNRVVFDISARSFLHHQVRIMVGTLAMVGKGKWKPGDVRTALEARDRTKSGPTAPADGLYLTQVDYYSKLT
jgi:tRNA pseudouridine38-40 synthase